MEKLLKNIFESPASTFEKTIEASQHLGKSIGKQTQVKKAKEFWRALGPGLVTGAADDDPSGIATYSQTGAQYGFQLLWLSVFTFPLMAVIQEMCARIALVTGRGLAANIRRHYPRWVLYLTTTLLFFANTFNIGANLGAMAQATQLLFPDVQFGILIVVFSLVCLALQIFIPYRQYSQYLKFLVFVLFSYILSAFMVQLDWQMVFQATITPTLALTKDQIIIVCAILGTTISPYLFFWQTSHEVEEEIVQGKTTIQSREGTTNKELKLMRKDVWAGMFISNLVMFFIIATCAGTLNAVGITEIQTAADAARALQPIAGEYTYLLFTLGIIGTGLLAVPILAGAASYAISESFRWKYGLYRKLKEASAFYGAIIISMLVGLGLNFVGIDPIKALVYSAVINGLVAPVVLVLIVLISSSPKIMGEHASRPLTSLIGWIVTVLMVLAGGATLLSPFLP